MNFWLTVLAVIVAQEIHSGLMVLFNIWQYRMTQRRLAAQTNQVNQPVDLAMKALGFTDEELAAIEKDRRLHTRRS